MKKILALVLVLSMVLGSFGFAFAATTAETNAGQVLKGLGVLTGDAQGNLMLDQVLKRQDMIVLLSRLMGAEDEAKAFPVPSAYEDITDAYYKPFIGWAQVEGLTDGIGNNKFGFDQELTVKELATFLLRALGHEGAWDKAETLAVELGLVATGANFEAKASRGFMAEATLAALEAPIATDAKTSLGTTLGFDGFELTPPAPVVPEKLEIVSVSANNYKQAVIEFNAELDKSSAEEKDNYTISSNRAIESVELLEDGRSVLLTLIENGSNSQFDRQVKYELSVDKVMDATKAVTANIKEYEFSAVDVTIPTVNSVTALGTKAIRVEFSEPVTRSSALALSNYKIDGKSFGGTVQYTYPNVVIITTSMSVGDKVLEVSNTADFAGFKVNQKDLAFTVVEDKTAPQIVSIKSIDLKEVEIEFDEPVKSASKVYFNADTADSRKTNPTIKDNKITAEFTNPMSVAGVTIYVVDVEDYSGNKATRTIELVPSIDTTRPEVTKVDVKLEGAVHQFTVTFNKNVDVTASSNDYSALNGKNYTLKNSEDKVVTGKGLDHKGQPVVQISQVGTSRKEVRFTLTDKLAAGTYTLEVKGIRDIATIGNIMLPQTYTFTIGDTSKPSVLSSWVDDNTGISATNAKRPVVYVEFSEAMATSGNGTVLDLNKYSYREVGGTMYIPFPTSTTVELVTDSVVKLTLPSRTTALSIDKLRVSLVADLADNFINNLVQENITVNSNMGSIAVTKVEATKTDELKVEFNGVLTTIDANDFVVTNGATNYSLTYESSSVKDGKTTVVFKISNKLLPNAKIIATDGAVANFATKTGSHVIATQNAFGAKVAATSFSLTDKISPSVADLNSKAFEVALEGTDYVVKFRSNEQIANNLNAKDVIQVKFGTKTARIDSVTPAVVGTEFIVTVNLGSTIVEKAAPHDAITGINDNTVVELQLLPENKALNYVGDGSNSMDEFTRTSILSYVKTGTFNDQQDVAAAKTALTTLALDNAAAVAPKVLKPANHANGATYALTVGTFAGNGDGGTAVVDVDGNVEITRDGTDPFTFVITVTITKGGETGTKLFNVTVPTGTDAVTVIAQ